MKRFWFLRGIKIFFFIILVVSVVGFVVMSLWNWLVPALFNGPLINFCQALGLLILCKILFGGFHKKDHHCPNCGGKSGWGGHWNKSKGNWKQMLQDKMKAKMANMTPEEKEKFKRKFGNRCGIFDNEEKESAGGDENTSKE